VFLSIGYPRSQEGIVSTPRKLEEIASELDDISLTVEELKETARSDDSIDPDALDEVQRGIGRASEAIDDAVDPETPENSDRGD
jgi:hypothetical protein